MKYARKAQAVTPVFHSNASTTEQLSRDCWFLANKNAELSVTSKSTEQLLHSKTFHSIKRLSTVVPQSKYLCLNTTIWMPVLIRYP